jgi:hypothetical protein
MNDERKRRGPCAFKQKDLTKVIKSLRAAGLSKFRVELDDKGKPVVLADGADVENIGSSPHNSWDDAVAALEKKPCD